MKRTSQNYEEAMVRTSYYLNDIIQGKKLPPLYSDVIAKIIFDPDKHPDRLEFLLRAITGDDTIRVDKSSRNEGSRKSEQSKGMIFDIPVWLMDRRLANMEFQKSAQNYILKRGEIYSSDLLLIEYSAEKGHKKGEVSFDNVASVIVLVLLVESPQMFLDYDRYSDHYIHRFEKMTADSGLSYDPLVKIIYIQLDKCLRQLRRGYNAEEAHGKPDELQLWLSSIADINDYCVRRMTEGNVQLQSIQDELHILSQDKEVQAMITAEELARMDYYSAKSEARKLGLAEGREAGLAEGREAGLAEGREAGLAEGRNSEVFSSVQAGDYSLRRGMEKLHLNEIEFRRKAKAAGYDLDHIKG